MTTSARLRFVLVFADSAASSGAVQLSQLGTGTGGSENNEED